MLTMRLNGTMKCDTAPYWCDEGNEAKGTWMRKDRGEIWQGKNCDGIEVCIARQISEGFKNLRKMCKNKEHSETRKLAISDNPLIMMIAKMRKYEGWKEELNGVYKYI